MLKKIFDRLAADPEKMGLKTRFHLKLASVEALVFGCCGFQHKKPSNNSEELIKATT